jgi:hypothetical protein
MFTPDSVEMARLEQRTQSGARWFFWIAALSLITSLIMLYGSHWGFILSLGITQIIDAIASEAGAGAGSIVKAVAFALDLSVAGIFALFGVFAGKKHLWAFVTGMVLFGLDALIFLLAQDWFGIAFHAYALYGIFAGFRACRKLLALQAEAKLYTENQPQPEAAV